MNLYLFIIFCLIPGISQAKKITFSKLVLPAVEDKQQELSSQEQIIVVPEQKLHKPVRSDSLLSYTTLNMIINGVSCVYAAYKIYKRYHEIGKPMPETIMYKIIGYIKPIPLQSI